MVQSLGGDKRPQSQMPKEFYLISRIEVLIYQTRAQMEAFPIDPDVFQGKFHRVMEEDFAVCRLLQANVHI